MKKEDLQKILDDLAYGDKYGEVLRAKGMVPSEEKGVWLHFDMVPEQAEIREGAPDFTGKVCVIGAGVMGAGIAAVAAGVYFVDVRPRLLEVQGKSR